MGKTSQSDGTRSKNCMYVLSTIFLAFGFACINMYHVSTMFENDRHFSHLSTLEREMTFRTEMGLYYSYYKYLVEAPTFTSGLHEILHDKKTEYPSEINALKRFNLYPEVILSLLYRGYMYASEIMNLKTKQCWKVERGNGLLPVTSCEGLGDPIYFYLEGVWWCAGLTMALIFLFGQLLSGSIAGGVLSVICYFYNHTECTRVQWTPPLRESFAYPACLMQMMILTKFLRTSEVQPESQGDSTRSTWIKSIAVISIPTWLFLTLWQFAQFVIITQVLAVFLLYCLGIIRRKTCLTVVVAVMCAIANGALCLFANEFLLLSCLTCLVLSMVIVLLLDPLVKDVGPLIRTIVLCVTVFIITLILKGQMNLFSGYQDDMHIINLLRAKLTQYKDFDTLLYTCSLEFDFLPWDFIRSINETLLLPTATMAIILVLHHWWNLHRQSKKSSNRHSSATKVVDPEIAYNILQLVAFAAMAIMIMRLKLFFTPQLCVMTSLMASAKFNRFPTQGLAWAGYFLLIGGMSARGIANLDYQRNVLGEYSNVPMEQLFLWITSSTKPDAVFAGPMPLMANVLLSTRRPVVNHPHYEHVGLRARTKKVYSVFSRKSQQEVYITLSKMGVDYVILEDVWCFGESRKGCSMKSLWDVEDPVNINRPPLCPVLFNQNPSPFHRVFANDVYVVLQIGPESQYVELYPPKHYRQ